jgi:transaldolase/glucose-6-phosphate isomerase
VAGGGDAGRVAGVASFFISRIDTAVEGIIDERLAATTAAGEQALLHSLSGKVAIANAKLAYQRYREIFAGPRWQALAERGARSQRLLWASTGTKNPRYPDVIYVEELIGPDTVNTMPPATLDAFRDHGRPRASLIDDVEGARDTMATVEELGIAIKGITDRLLDDGVRLFSEAYDKLLAAVERQARDAGRRRINPLIYSLPGELGAEVRRSLAEWDAEGKARRLWQRDASLWTGKDEGQWLGWLGITNDQLAHVERFTRIAEAARTGGFSHVLLLGMGGSSLGPEVLRLSFGKIPGFPELLTLDSTDPAQVKAREQAIDLAHTLFIVSSKSGATLEPNIFKQYFFTRVAEVVGPEQAGSRFIAITDPGSKVQHVAEADRFRHVFFGWSSIGGRYSVLSDFGLVPAAVMGVDVARLLDRTEAMVCACMPSVPVEDNPGVVLGTILGLAATGHGRDKVTFMASPRVASLGAWLEQLIAESTGKEGKGLIPVDREPSGDPASYGNDRLFVFLTMRGDDDQDQLATALQRAGHPVVRVTVEDPYDIGQEFFRWEIATAVAGSLLGVHPFDQPDVEASKIATRNLTAAYEEQGSLPAEAPFFTGDGISLFSDQANAQALAAAPATLAGKLRAHLARLAPGDYFALLAYLEMNEAHDRVLQAIRDQVRRTRRVATCMEFGPRFLHSTGQGYKGGPNTGVFVQITCDDAIELPVPGQKYTFGVVKAAQARGDFDVLVQRGRRALRVHLGKDVAAGLAAFQAALLADRD